MSAAARAGMAEGVVSPTRLPAAADPRRAMPVHAGARLDAIETALRVLGEEDRRLGRMGLDGARARCRDARRFWGFVGALYHLAEGESR